MSEAIERCSNRHRKPKFVLSEKRSRVEINNPKRTSVREIQVDGCAINDDQPRCDYLIDVEKEDLSLFVELKGSDVEHAIVQLERSWKILRAETRRNVFWIISSTRSPRFPPALAIVIRKLREKHGVTLIQGNTPVSFDLATRRHP